MYGKRSIVPYPEVKGNYSIIFIMYGKRSIVPYPEVKGNYSGGEKIAGY